MQLQSYKPKSCYWIFLFISVEYIWVFLLYSSPKFFLQYLFNLYDIIKYSQRKKFSLSLFKLLNFILYLFHHLFFYPTFFNFLFSLLQNSISENFGTAIKGHCLKRTTRNVVGQSGSADMQKVWNFAQQGFGSCIHCNKYKIPGCSL